MHDTVLLAIETSQRQGGVALRDREGRVQVETLMAAKRHDDDLMPAVERCFAASGLRPAELHAVGVSIGPGGFTGLRIAVTTAKMLAETLGVKIIAVPSAVVAAESHGSDDGPILVALAGKSETAWITRLIKRDGALVIDGSPGLMDAAMVDFSDVRILLADQYLPEPIRAKAVTSGVAISEPVFAPDACLLVGDRMLRAGRVSDPVTLIPLYPRPPEAVRLWATRSKSG